MINMCKTLWKVVTWQQCLRLWDRKCWETLFYNIIFLSLTGNTSQGHFTKDNIQVSVFTVFACQVLTCSLVKPLTSTCSSQSELKYVTMFACLIGVCNSGFWETISFLQILVWIDWNAMLRCSGTNQKKYHDI